MEEAWRYSETAMRMMRSMNWTGKGLGTREQGRREPIETKPQGAGREGLGARKSAARSPRAKREDKLKAVVRQDNSLAYGFPTEDGASLRSSASPPKARPAARKRASGLIRSISWM
jgi:hypothetical protein